MKRFTFTFAVGLFAALSGNAAITISPSTFDKTKFADSVTFTVTADPAAATTTATLDGVAVSVGTPVTVTAVSYHELRAESRDAGGGLLDSRLARFIVHDSARAGSEDGIPPHTPFKHVPDAPSAFIGKTLKVAAPATWPAGLPVPLAVKLRDGANESVWLNGLVTFGGFPKITAPLRRGWGSVQAPAVENAGAFDIAASVNALTASRTMTIEAAPVFTTVSGAIASNTTWAPNSRIHVTGTLTIDPGATLTVGAGTIVKVFAGTATNGSAAEIVVNGTLQVNGTEAAPVVFLPDTAGGKWGGIELRAVTSMVNAQHTFFTGSGEDEDWFSNNPGVGGSSHQGEQVLFLLAGSGSGTDVGAQFHLTDCYCIDNAQVMNSKTNTWVDLSRTLYQRAITSGELNGSKVTIDRSALIEFPSETENFVNDDNDALYLTGGDLSISNTVIGFTKDDGVDSGGNGGDNPFTAAADVTPFVSTRNWFEGTYHEGNSLSGTRNVTFTGCVFFNCGQGVEAGYSASSTGDGPNAIVDGCLFASNMVGVRWGDNYGSGYNYNATMEVKNSILLHNFYRDAFSGQWHPTQANAWIYQTTATNSFGKPYFNVHDNLLSQPDSLHHPANTAWNSANPTHAAQLASFMPVPGSAVGVGISSYAPAQSDTKTYPGSFKARLSTFSSQPVTVNWSVIAKVDAFGDGSAVLASGDLTFAPGETLKTITAPIANPGSYGLIRVALSNAVNAEVTGEAWYFLSPTPDPTLVSLASGGWRYRETPSEPPATWKQPGFDDSSAAATEWLPCTLPAGFGVSGVTFGTSVAPGSSSDRTRAYYFRKRFTVPAGAPMADVTFRIRRDDAAAVWLNGEAVPSVISADGTFNPPYTYAMTGTAGAVPNSNNTSSYLSYSIPPSKLIAGENVIAIEVHQTSLTSSDLILDCELAADYQPPFSLRATRAGGNPLLYWADPDAVLEVTTDFSGWQPFPGARSPLLLDLSGGRKFFRLRK